MIAILIAALLAGSAGQDEPYWRLTERPLQHGKTYHYKTDEALIRACSRTGEHGLKPGERILACVYRLEESGLYFIHAGPEYDDCVKRHEDAHGAGWTHPEGRALIKDCGPAEFEWSPRAAN